MLTDKQKAARKNIPDIEVFVLAGRGVNRVLKEWLSIVFRPGQVHLFDPAKEIPDFVGEPIIATVTAARNEIARRFLETTDKPWLVTFDDDMYPLPETLEMLASDDPIVSCRVWGPQGQENHSASGSVCFNAAKVARNVLTTMTPLLFEYENRGGHVECERLHFAAKAREQGSQPKKAGQIGHRVPYVATIRQTDDVRLVPERNVPPPRAEDYWGVSE
jgi:hypothetical protein